MIALVLCVVAFLACYWAGRRSLGQGLVMLLVFGYFYGILRANLLTTFSHFIFDAGMLGLFLSTLWSPSTANEKKRSEKLLMFTMALILWPVVLVMLPFQPFLVSLVGLRGNVFFIPVLLLGSRLKEKDLIELSVGLAVLDLVAVGFAGAEYFMGLQRFFPFSPVTQIIYNSRDAGGGFYRIPAIFSSAHAFGGTMVDTIPFLIGLWIRGAKRSHRWLALITIPTALLGILMSATRSNFILGSAMIVFIILTAKMRGKQKALFLVIIAGITSVALTNARFQRFKSLGDTDFVAERIAGSVNRGFWEILTEYPMGNGLGGGGTSIPYFLEGQVRNPIGMENDYSRILSEQGVIGLLIWVSFIVWFLFRLPIAFKKSRWMPTRRLVWCLAVTDLGTALIGLGLLTSIPGTLLLMLGVGWTSMPQAPEQLTVPRGAGLTSKWQGRPYAPAVESLARG